MAQTTLPPPAITAVACGAAKWHAAASVLPVTAANSGAVWAQACSALGHRVRNRQPEGRWSGLGTFRRVLVVTC